MSQQTRITLLDRLRNSSNPEDWEEFVSIYDALILNWLQLQGVSHADADDVRQEVMMTVYQELPKFQHNGRTGAFRNWLRKVTSNRLRRLWDKKKSVEGSIALDYGQIADELEDDQSRLTVIWIKQHNEFVLARLLDRLAERFSPQSLAAFRRIVLDQESPQVVADDLGLSIGAVRVAQFRVLRVLRKMASGLIA